MKRCLFGGSFDPVHLGHLHIAARAREACTLDQVVLLPCAQSPLKTASPVASDCERLDMLGIALAATPWASVDDTDLLLPPPSWSWRIAQAFRERFPDDELYWLMGADQWNDLERWGRWEYFADMVTFIVHHRQQELTARPGVRAVFVQGEHAASSSAIRRLLADGMPVPDGWMDPAVLSYALERGIYKKVTSHTSAE